jgi:hypothetical protein
MLILILVLGALTAIVISSRVRVPGGANAEKLGQMSEQWVANHRASRIS